MRPEHTGAKLLSLKTNTPTLIDAHLPAPRGRSIVEAIGHTGLQPTTSSPSESTAHSISMTSTTSLEPRTSQHVSAARGQPGPRGFLASRAIRIRLPSCSPTVARPPTCRSARASCGRRRRRTEGPTEWPPVGLRTWAMAAPRNTFRPARHRRGHHDRESWRGSTRSRKSSSVKGVHMAEWGGSDYSMGIARAGERYSPRYSRGAPRVRNGHQDGRAAPAEIATADQAKYFLDMGVGTSPSAPTSPSCTVVEVPG